MVEIQYESVQKFWKIAVRLAKAQGKSCSPSTIGALQLPTMHQIWIEVCMASTTPWMRSYLQTDTNQNQNSTMGDTNKYYPHMILSLGWWLIIIQFGIQYSK